MIKQERKLIVGLGNPGAKYENTRHNLGFVVLDQLAANYSLVWREDKKWRSVVVEREGFVLLKPQTMMNASGLAVAKLKNFFRISTENVWVVHDDLDLPLGVVRLSLGSGAAGHKGVASVIQELGSQEFLRFRLGISQPAADCCLAEEYVLKCFRPEEKQLVERLIDSGAKAIDCSLKKGVESAMNQFNSQVFEE